MRPRLEAGVVCCVLSHVDGRLKVRQIEGGPHAWATSLTGDPSATTSVVERRRVARLRAVIFSTRRGPTPAALTRAGRRPRAYQEQNLATQSIMSRGHLETLTLGDVLFWKRPSAAPAAKRAGVGPREH